MIKNKPKPVVYPDQTALKKLDSLNLSYSKKKIGQKEFFLNIVDVLREYIEKRYNIKASRMTTEQFVRKLTRTREISKESKEFIISLLNRKDSIKFAAEDIPSGELEGSSSFIKRY